MRAIRTLLIVAVVLAGLFVAADRAAVWYAEKEAADKIRSSQNMSGTPDVSIKGFPFLTQVAGKKLDEVEVSLGGGVTAGTGENTIRVTDFDATLHGVEIDSSFTSAVAERATGTAHISYADLSRIAGMGITVGYGGKDASGNGRVKVTGSLPLPMGQVTRSVFSSVTLVNGTTVRVHAEKVPDDLPGLEGLIRKKTDFERQITGLPKGVTLAKVNPTQGGIDIELGGTDVRLAG
ncbi:DUF2993 domain-containing protein [Streptomyces sp. AV19]|uniref:LmeA family phospholipid-binding protein n=1 Tax=Streptomyces sp. AV19 TaxID=2793068 RepID=UPI0018FE8CCA|nr:DUF2993 domain-containing protein [Streptomyces sp. AV19]MBH1936158.1 DUF2993 domain-containing protein [Streptomyces sp. AV19]MDG4534661.1 DUF2993 domain-containing protein [Streptomyces sp. AV19]